MPPLLLAGVLILTLLLSFLFIASVLDDGLEEASRYAIEQQKEDCRRQRGTLRIDKYGIYYGCDIPTR